MLIVAAALLWHANAHAQEHRHPPQDTAIHEQFYATWNRPDDPTKTCCSKEDCYPTEIRYRGGHLLARQRENGAWVVVLPQKIERNRDNPDGRNHVCMSKDGTVFCFSLGTGG